MISKLKTIDLFFKRKEVDLPENSSKIPRLEPEKNHDLNSPILEYEGIHFTSSTLNSKEIDISSLQRDPGLHPSKWDYPVNQCDKIRIAYLKMSPYQIHISKYPFSGSVKHHRRFQASCSEQILNNRLRVKISIDVVRWLAFQGCAFRGHDETLDSKNRVIAKKVRNKIHEDVGDSRFCIIIDETRDEFKIDGFIQEPFFDLVYVKDTSTLILNNEIFVVLSRHCLDIPNIRRQGYDGTSNMHGEWNGLQALFLKDYSYAYYVHCFAHRLQLALVAAFREVVFVYEFFSNLNFIINVVGASYKRHDELQAAQTTHIEHMIAIDKLEIYCECLKPLAWTYSKVRNEGWKNLLENVISFSKKFNIDILELSSHYVQGHGRQQRDHITIEHHYHFEIFNATIYFQIQELDNRFGERMTKLLTLNSALDPKDGYKSFNIDYICCLNEKINLRFQLKHFEVDVFINPMFQDLRSITDLCRRLVETEKSKTYYLIDRLVRLILTLPVSIATNERAFSAIKIVKTRLRNKIEDEFLTNNLVIYFEREIAKNFDLDSILDDFVCLKECKLQF
ncbi:hypothetical protein I3842_13G122100 [Carya illinoinensis]|uniref:Zinc finger MYM-type protein 1-like n=1 Tax=Carya illinoinensis TaxID=32201 RepID=A0A922AI71_CARIL|nr:hypothetical protein I3842_13G122100 [Carya illinoinensis]